MNQTSSHFSSSPSLQIAPMSVASMPSFDNNGLDTAQVSLNRLQQLIGLLDSSLRLPTTPRAFLVYLLGLAIVFAGAFMHVMVAAQIMQAEFTLSQLQEEYRALEQQNGDIIFQIARDTNLARLHQRVMDEGYVAVEKREYIFAPRESLLAATAPAAETPVANTAAPLAATAPTTPVAPVNNAGGGQWARWEEFWNNTLFPATSGATTANVSANASVNAATPNKSQSTKTAPDFWSVWWEQASEQGSKLLEQFRSQ